MIKFIKPCFNSEEETVLASKKAPDGHRAESLKDDIFGYFHGERYIAFANSGSEAITGAVRSAKRLLDIHHPVIAIPAAICGNVYNAVKDEGEVILMDADETWNCVYDDQSMESDIILFASLGGKRMAPPQSASMSEGSQIVIDDSAQCFDFISGFRQNTDFSIFSFGPGKQMFAGFGGILYSERHGLGDEKKSLGSKLEDWNLFLMSSQLSKVHEINSTRIRNAHYLIDALSDVPWLSLPEKDGNVFSKFTVFIDHNDGDPLKPERPFEIIRFIRHMRMLGVEVEETYIPLNVRFPDQLRSARTDRFNVNRLWLKAITLPCRPGLTFDDLDRVVNAVRLYDVSASGSVSVPSSFERSSEKPNILCVNHQPVSLYKEQGWSDERLASYYNPGDVGQCVVAAYGEKKPWSPSASVKVVGFETRDDIEKIMTGFDPDVMRCYEANQPFAGLALELSKMMNIPSYLSLHDSRKALDPKLAQYTVITAYTETLAKSSGAYLGRKVELQRNGVDSDFFNPYSIDAKPAGWLQKHDFVIFTIGRNDPVKNVDCMIEAINVFMLKTGIDVHFVISGPGFDERRYNGLEFITFLGKTNQNIIRDVLMHADLFLQVQLVPEISMAAIEALMMDVPIINAENEETRSMVSMPVGLTVNIPDSPSVIADYIHFAYNNMETFRSTNGSRRAVAMKRFNASDLRTKEADRYRELYKKSLEWKTDKTMRA